ncbi:MAG: ChaN family lipoprotein [Cyanobacteriota bacterium]|nr:ChaN family lipoprotein [Cyanobacteriota bacterium]
MGFRKIPGQRPLGPPPNGVGHALAPPRLLVAPLLLLIGVGSGLPSGIFAAPPPPAAPDAPQPLGPVCARALAAARAQEAHLEADAHRLAVLLLGEIHTSADDHHWQLATLERLTRGGRTLALGLEMVPAARQSILTRYGRGQMGEAEFLAAVEWSAIWGHDPELYLPLLRWARRQGVPLLALNVEPELARRVRRLGLAAVPPGEREGIGPPAPAGTAYRERLRTAWRAHRVMTGPLSPRDADDLERFIDSQRLRDRAMAEGLAAARRREPGRLVVALIGRGHLEGDDGVPAQLRQLGVGQVAVLERPAVPEGCGGPPPGARLGAYLESADGAVWVRRVAPGSAAAAAGLRPGDRIRAVNGALVERAGQVIRQVRAQPAGVPLRLTIERQGRVWQLELRLLAPPVTASPGRMDAKFSRNGPAVS